jgi:predicted DNA-binding WGR domain protein
VKTRSGDALDHRDLRGGDREGRAAHLGTDVGVGMDLTRIDPPNNLHRFYRMEIAPGLLGGWALVREWGRIGQSGQVLVTWYDTEAAAKGARFYILMKKAKRGYK